MKTPLCFLSQDPQEDSCPPGFHDWSVSGKGRGGGRKSRGPSAQDICSLPFAQTAALHPFVSADPIPDPPEGRLASSDSRANDASTPMSVAGRPSQGPCLAAFLAQILEQDTAGLGIGSSVAHACLLPRRPEHLLPRERASLRSTFSAWSWCPTPATVPSLLLSHPFLVPRLTAPSPVGAGPPWAVWLRAVCLRRAPCSAQAEAVLSPTPHGFVPCSWTAGGPLEQFSLVPFECPWCLPQLCPCRLPLAFWGFPSLPLWGDALWATSRSRAGSSPREWA